MTAPSLDALTNERITPSRDGIVSSYLVLLLDSLYRARGAGDEAEARRIRDYVRQYLPDFENEEMP